ncbi:MAG: calycin-like domain-containing protein [Bacteroidales bacterium]|jgi:hypothetical protein|nr:calycin-like domain-containing protein [Bacteroidales bacterium]
MKLLNAFLIAAVSVVAAACSKNEPVKIIETPAETVYSGTMTVVAGGKDNVSENVKVNVNLQDDGTATIIFNKVKFVPQMPVSLDVTVPGVTCEIRKNEIILSGNDIVPLAMGMPYAKYKVTSLSGKITAGKLTVSLNFGEFATSYVGDAQ